MTLIENLNEAFARVFLDPQAIVAIIVAAFYGVFMGAIPGLTATMAVALLVPLTFYLGEVPALAAVVTLEACAIFSGDIPTTLVRIPGTPSSAAYTDDAYALTQAGRHREALGVSLIFSVVGGLLGAIALIALARQLAELAVLLTSFEYFWLYLLGLSCAAVVSRGSPLRGAVALLIGLLLSTVGLSSVYGEARFTFEQPELYGGIQFIPALIGLFGVSEVLRGMLLSREELGAISAPTPLAARRTGVSRLVGPLRAVFAAPLRLLPRRWIHTLRSSGVGAFIGMLPGAGADIAAWVSLALSKRFSRKPAEYGKGSLDAISDATSANNAALAGAWIPALVFGIPGDSVTAIVIGVLYMKNISPGPDIFENQAPLVYSIYIVFVLANLLLLPIGYLAIRAGTALVCVPRRVLLPCVLIFCVVGSYAINASYFDLWVLLAMGVLGFGLERLRIPLGPVVLGILLGAPLEEKLIQSLTKSRGEIGPFFEGPGCWILASACIGLWVAPVVLRLVFRRDRNERRAS